MKSEDATCHKQYIYIYFFLSRESPRKPEMLGLIIGSSASFAHVTFVDVPVAKAKLREPHKTEDTRKHDSLELLLQQATIQFLKTLYFHLLENCYSIFILLEQDTSLLSVFKKNHCSKYVNV